MHTALTSVQVLGTAFNINTYQPGIVKTALVQGSVITKGKTGVRRQTPANRVSRPTTIPDKDFVTSHFDEEEVLSWRNGVYCHYRMPLTTLIAAASRFYGMRFVLR